ncbi:alpha/beta hydrolase family protein [Haliea sp.]|uniref:alpha/beta hydrolase family protein n=1 Tax=Haliea sp. TaxID=1932666 RepID=UPI003529978D
MKTVLKFLLIVSLLVGGGLWLLATGKQPEPFVPGTESAARLQPGPLPVVKVERDYVDTSRRTDANGDYPGAADRRLETTLWYPENRESAPYPLLVYSHGFSSSRQEAESLAAYLASHGYIVIAPTYPLTNLRAPGGPRVQDVVNQPADVRFLIDELLAASETPGNALYQQVDPERIGALGLSLGGLTSTLVAFHPEMRDPRISAALSIAGPTFVFTDVFYRHHPLPFLMLAGDIDAIVPWEDNARPVPEQVPDGELVTLRGASHAGFADPAAAMRWLSNPDAVGCWIVQRSMAGAEEEPWFDLIGPPEMGINYGAESALCTMDPLPEAMNPLRQQMLTRVVVGSFFDRQFSRSAATRAAAERYLSEVLAEELMEATYVRAAD